MNISQCCLEEAFLIDGKWECSACGEICSIMNGTSNLQQLLKDAESGEWE